MAGKGEREDFVYRVSTVEQWEELLTTGATVGGDLDRTTGCIHLSSPHQLGEGLIYEPVDEISSFPHFYGPSRSFSPLPLEAVTKSEKLVLVNSEFTCNLLEQEQI